MKSWVIKNSKDINIQGVPKSSCLISSLIIIDNPIEYFHSRAGGGGTPLYGLYGDMPLDWVWFFISLSLTGYIKFRLSLSTGFCQPD